MSRYVVKLEEPLVGPSNASINRLVRLLHCEKDALSARELRVSRFEPSAKVTQMETSINEKV